jgi:crotonobetaine/carnitine-CoA ligase
MGRAARHPDSALPFAELRVVDEDGHDVENGVIGELLVRTPVMMKGYYRDPAQTASAFRDGWFCSGDLVRRDDTCSFYFVARKSDIIRRRGENIAAAEIERVVSAHPAVVEAAAVAVPSDLGEDEVLVAAVVAPGLNLTPEDVASWCGQRLAPAKRPRYVTLLPELPHTPTHRIAKSQLDRQALLAAATDLQGTV